MGSERFIPGLHKQKNQLLLLLQLLHTNSIRCFSRSYLHKPSSGWNLSSNGKQGWCRVVITTCTVVNRRCGAENSGCETLDDLFCLVCGGMASLSFHYSHTQTTVNKRQFCVWEGCFSKCGPWTNSISITWEVGRNITCGSHPRTAKSDTSHRHIAQCILTSLWKIPASANMWQALIEESCLNILFRRMYWTTYSIFFPDTNTQSRHFLLSQSFSFVSLSGLCKWEKRKQRSPTCQAMAMATYVPVKCKDTFLETAMQPHISYSVWWEISPRNTFHPLK